MFLRKFAIAISISIAAPALAAPSARDCLRITANYQKLLAKLVAVKSSDRYVPFSESYNNDRYQFVSRAIAFDYLSAPAGSDQQKTAAGLLNWINGPVLSDLEDAQRDSGLELLFAVYKKFNYAASQKGASERARAFVSVSTMLPLNRRNAASDEELEAKSREITMRAGKESLCGANFPLAEAFARPLPSPSAGVAGELNDKAGPAR
jgi:hypothetical protein